jgi:hypothetical protein
MDAHSIRVYCANGNGDGYLQPEKRLMVAVLQDAVECFQNYKFEPRSKPTNEFLDSEGWIFEDDPKWPFSFSNICEAVGMDAAGLRQGLLRWKKNTPRTDIRCQSNKPGATSARQKQGPAATRSMANGGR